MDIVPNNMFRFEPWSGDNPMIYFSFSNNRRGNTAFIPFKHTMDIYVKSPNSHFWTYSDNLADEIAPDEFPPEVRRIRPWEWIIKLDANYRHETEISCCSRTIHGTQLEIRSKKDYRGQSYHNPNLTMLFQDPDVELMRQAVEGLIISARHFNIRSAEDVQVSLGGSISLYEMNRFSYSHKEALRQAH